MAYNQGEPGRATLNMFQWLILICCAWFRYTLHDLQSNNCHVSLDKCTSCVCSLYTLCMLQSFILMMFLPLFANRSVTLHNIFIQKYKKHFSFILPHLYLLLLFWGFSFLSTATGLKMAEVDCNFFSSSVLSPLTHGQFSAVTNTQALQTLKNVGTIKGRAKTLDWTISNDAGHSNFLNKLPFCFFPCFWRLHLMILSM